ncbi:hypothetical protein AB4144_59400, partial [Rhizobiaceae sp. 2RAB30]
MVSEIVHGRHDARYDAGGCIGIVFRNVVADLVEPSSSPTRPAQWAAAHALWLGLPYFVTTLANSSALAN